jgi:hypothetical protein
VIYLKNAGFTGDQADVAEVLKNFGDLYLGGGHLEPPVPNYFFIVKKFVNWYKDNEGIKPLYVLIPNRIIFNVWPDNLENYLDVKYGTATKNRIPITGGVVIQNKDRVGLYVCLDPAGEVLEDGDGFGI